MRCVFRAFPVFLVMAFIGCKGKAQSLNGFWEGKFARSVFIFPHPRAFQIEIISNNDTSFTGSSHWLYSTGKYEHYKIAGKFNVKDSIVTFEETLIGTNFISVSESAYKMKLKKVNNKLLLDGNWKDKGRDKYISFNKVWLQKKDSADINRHKSIIAEADSIKSLEKRVVDIQKIIELTNAERDSIKIDVYDDGEIDGDSVSLYLNDSLLINNSLISARPLSFILSLNKSIQFNKIKMVAENLGSVPPNTGLMIITTRKQRYEIRLDSDLNKTAAVEFIPVE